MPGVSIQLPAGFSKEHRRVVLKYFQKAERLTPAEWKTAFEAFDTLGTAEVVVRRRRKSFHQTYERLVDASFADEFIAITRLYHSRQRRYHWVVLMTEAAWHTLNGAVAVATLETAAAAFPEPVRVVLGEQPFVIAPYDLWKAKVRRRQREEEQP